MGERSLKGDRLHLASVHEPKMDTRAHDHALHAGGARCEHAEELARADAHRKRAGDTDFSLLFVTFVIRILFAKLDMCARRRVD